MIISMTGYGEVHRIDDGVEYALGIRSVNNRYFKSVIRLPEAVQFLESEVEKQVRARLTRGSVTVNLRMRNATATAAYDVNQAALSRYVESLSQVEIPAGVQATMDLAALSNLPGVCQVPEIDKQEQLHRSSIVSEMIEACLDGLTQMRRREGQSLHDDIIQHSERMRSELDEVAERSPVVLTEYRERLASRVERLTNEGKLDLESDALSREVALFADRSDISEEISRLRGHLDHFVEVCDSEDAVGRKLDFLAQEMLREANTIGSKSNDGQIARSVVIMKTLIDRIKEQVQNVE